MKSLQAAESQVKKHEERLSEEDIVPADTAAIQALRDQLKVSRTNNEKYYCISILVVNVIPKSSKLL